MIFKKGAMFGLDARVALAIFGALSVISGAALYSAIQTANSTKTFTTIKEVEKAIEQFMLDTGSYFPENASNSNVMLIGNLYENHGGFTGWNGPYIGYGSTDNRTMSINITGRTVFLDKRVSGYRQASSTWSGADDGNAGPCVSGDCSIYISQYTPSSRADDYAYLNTLFLALDEHVDNSDGTRAGLIRASLKPTQNTLYFKMIPDMLYLSNN